MAKCNNCGTTSVTMTPVNGCHNCNAGYMDYSAAIDEVLDKLIDFEGLTAPNITRGSINIIEAKQAILNLLATARSDWVEEVLGRVDELSGTFTSKTLQKPHPIDMMGDLYAMRNEALRQVKAILGGMR